MSAADKKKLDGVATGAQVNVLESVTASGTAPLTLSAGTITNKSIAISGSIADATTNAKGVVKIGDGITVTNGTISVTAANLGLSNAMHFIGTSATAVTDGGNENPTISGYSTKTAGDVIIYGNNEYVYTANNKWELLGQDGSYKITQTAVSKPTAVTNKWISAIGQNANGEIDVSYADLDIATLASDSGFITGMYIASYGSSTYADVLAAYQAKKIVYCRASSNSDPSSGEQKRLAFLAYVNYDTTPTEFEF
jgi:hypothetical protein